ncbi:MAG: hypothetical protein ACKVRO_00700 [Micropepsaceae bacterium]
MTWLLFLIFLGYYGYQQYYLGVSAPLEQANIQAALLMLSLTAIGPFFVSYALTRATQITGRAPAVLLGFVSSMTLALVGAWVAWKYFGGVGPMRVPIEEGLKLGLIPGVAMGIILAIDSLFRRRYA